MNIFMTDPCPTISAYNLCYVHTVKMILESCQLLSVAHRVIDGDVEADIKGLYRKTHVGHPSSVWCRESKENYMWLYHHTLALGEVYELATGKVHKSIEKLSDVLSEPPKGIPDGELTELTPAMDNEFKELSCNIYEKYQKYLSSKYNEWISREKPIKVEFIVAKPEWYV